MNNFLFSNIDYSFLKTKKGFYFGLLIGITLPLMLTLASVVYATGEGSPIECLNPTTTLTDNQNLLTFTAPEGSIVDGVCIHSGNNMFGGNQHSEVLSNGTYENGCYTVSGVGTQTITVQRVGTPSPTCQGLSHVDVLDGPTPSPSPTPTPIPSASPTPTPTPDITPTANPTPTPVVTPTPTPFTTTNPTPTPTVSPTPTPTPTPTPLPTTTSTPTSSPIIIVVQSEQTSSNNNNTNNGAVLGASYQNPSALEGAVLGASAELPETGLPMSWPILGITSFISGTGLIGLGLKKK